uniref:Uncharacterized protein n=1 Tax=Oryza meridionalis TaxID=40149 RepID=A0A0E0CMP2_9ORYZ
MAIPPARSDRRTQIYARCSSGSLPKRTLQRAQQRDAHTRIGHAAWNPSAPSAAASGTSVGGGGLDARRQRDGLDATVARRRWPVRTT